MKTLASASSGFEFAFPQLDPLVLVEVRAHDVLIRTSRDTFSAARKELFVRELVAEGFIPDDCHWFNSSAGLLSRGVHWVVDYRWLQSPDATTAIARRAVIRLLVGGAALWLALMGLLLTHHL